MDWYHVIIASLALHAPSQLEKGVVDSTQLDGTKQDVVAEQQPRKLLLETHMLGNTQVIDLPTH